MNILQVNAVYGEKSTGLIMADIGSAIEQSGNHAFYAYQKTNRPVPNGYQVGNLLDWKRHALLARLCGRQGFYSSRATRKLIEQMEKDRIDVLHLHNLHSNYIDIDGLLTYAAKRDLPTVITLHDCWWFTGKCFHYADCGCDRFIDGCHHCPKKDDPPKSIFFDRSARCWADKKKRLLAIPRLKVVGCSDWICGEAQKSFLQGREIVRIYNGVDTAVFKPCDTTGLKATLGVGDAYLVMGMANKWLEKRNADVLRRLYAVPDTQLLLVGCTDPQKAYLKATYPRVTAVGYVSGREQLAAYYRMADVFVNVTHADTLPTVNMESICCGTPVITYDSCGSPELVDAASGIVVPEDDADGILSAIERVRGRQYPDCATTGKTRFDKTASYPQYLGLYHDIVSGGTRK